MATYKIAVGRDIPYASIPETGGRKVKRINLFVPEPIFRPGDTPPQFIERQIEDAEISHARRLQDLEDDYHLRRTRLQQAHEQEIAELTAKLNAQSDDAE